MANSAAFPSPASHFDAEIRSHLLRHPEILAIPSRSVTIGPVERAGAERYSLPWDGLSSQIVDSMFASPLDWTTIETY